MWRRPGATPCAGPWRRLRPGAFAGGEDTARRGLFVTFEGLDASGKSTLLRILEEVVAGSGRSVYFTREPGGTPAAERVRGMVLDPAAEMDPVTEAYLYAAARADHARREILPRLGSGADVFCDRYLDSSIAYQGGGRGLGIGAVRALNEWAVGEAVPDLTFYLRVDAGERERRARGSAPDRIEKVGSAFMARAEAAFEEIARSEPARVQVLDGKRPPEDLARTVLRKVDERRSRARGG